MGVRMFDGNVLLFGLFVFVARACFFGGCFDSCCAADEGLIGLVKRARCYPY